MTTHLSVDDRQQRADEQRADHDARQLARERASWPAVTETMPEPAPPLRGPAQGTGRPMPASYAERDAAQLNLRLCGCFLPMHPAKRWRNEA